MSDMTRERAKEVLEMMLEDEDVRKVILRTDVDAMNIAISALTEELSADGTLTVHVKDGSKVKRVFVMGDNIFGGLYYPDSENKGHWKALSDGYGDNAYICECSECKDTVWVYKDTDRKWNFCPNCGADMRGKK